MQRIAYKFSNKTVQYYLDADFAYLDKLVDKSRAVIITDGKVFRHQAKKLKSWARIVIEPGEGSKVQATVDSIIAQLIHIGADRDTFLIGVGGGVVTDVTGYAASVFMRGLKFGFVPSSLLAMVDAAVGGKNGIDVGPYKNMVGTITQPEFLLYDFSLLRSLPKEEWINGFAEIIKHAAIRDARLFKELEQGRLRLYRTDKKMLAKLVRRNVMIKSEIVRRDEYESGDRRLLNFGHTLGHAIENVYGISHGRAVAIGMAYAGKISEEFAGFAETKRLRELLNRYGMADKAFIDPRKVMAVLKMDKKKQGSEMRYIILKKIGVGSVISIPLDKLEKILESVLAY